MRRKFGNCFFGAWNPSRQVRGASHWACLEGWSPGISTGEINRTLAREKEPVNEFLGPAGLGLEFYKLQKFYNVT